jgi:hypothetical protein
MDIACRLAAGRLRPLGSLATDEENLKAAEVWGEIYAAAEKLNKMTDPSAPRPVECPEHMVFEYYKRMREPTR